MNDLFDKEEQTLMRARDFLDSLPPDNSQYQQELANITKEYARLLRFLKQITRLSDKTTNYLNTDKLRLLDKVDVDALTGIYNRRFLEKNLERYIKSLFRAESTISVMMLDIDFFKNYNDTYGHSQGDICLRLIAEAFQKCLDRADDFVARYGGEEFLIVLPNTSKNGAIIMAHRVLDAMRSLNIAHEKSSVASYVTVSIGITSAVPVANQPPGSYIRQADKALYMSKSSGRNNYTYLDFEEEDEQDD